MVAKLAKITLKGAGKVGAIVGGTVLAWEGLKYGVRKVRGEEEEEYDEDEE